MNNNLRSVIDGVRNLLKEDKTGHDAEHAIRVCQMALRFCRDIPYANAHIVAMVALLHDCDDRKIFGDKAASELSNARAIMRAADIAADEEDIVCNTIHSISFNKRVAGIMPISIEGEIVADADMCDAIGATGITRCIQFGSAKGLPFFNPVVFPQKLSGEKYAQFGAQSPTVNHFFEKLLRIKDFCLTAPGKKEAFVRHQIMVDFLDRYFIENNVPQSWRRMLDNYRINQR